MKKDCSKCQRMRNGDCSGLTCIGFKPVPYQSSNYREILAAAREANDIRMGRIRKKSRKESSSGTWIYQPSNTRKPQKSAVNQTGAAVRKPAAQKDSDRRTVFVGRKLYYKNKFTGEICSGEIVRIVKGSIFFRFENRNALVNISDLGVRLFYTPGEAEKYGK